MHNGGKEWPVPDREQFSGDKAELRGRLLSDSGPVDRPRGGDRHKSAADRLYPPWPGACTMQTITPFLWFDDKAEEAARFYTSLFRNSEIRAVTRYGEAAAKAAGRPAGSTMTVVFTIDGQEFVALNGDPVFKFSEAVSFAINCETQEEIDRLWVALSDGG
jgi:uncharacterized glyoxalase superfamily protein PhnB